MAKDIFNRESDVIGGAFTAEGARLTFPGLGKFIQGGEDAAGLIVQNLGLDYTQQITRIFELGSPRVYYIHGRSQGNIQLQRVVGPRSIAEEFYRTYGDVCNVKKNILQFDIKTGCVEEDVFGHSAFVAKGVVITTIGIRVASQDVVINEATQMIFSALNFPKVR